MTPSAAAVERIFQQIKADEMGLYNDLQMDDHATRDMATFIATHYLPRLEVEGLVEAAKSVLNDFDYYRSQLREGPMNPTLDTEFVGQKLKDALALWDEKAKQT